MSSSSSAAFNGCPDSSSSPPPPPPPPPSPHNNGGHQPVPPVAAEGDIGSSAPPIFVNSSTSGGDQGERDGTRADARPITNPLQPSPSTSSSLMSLRDRFSSITTLTSSHVDLEAAHQPHHHQQAVQRSPIRGDTLLNLCVQAVLLIVQIHFQLGPSTTESVSTALGISVASFAIGFTSTWIGMFLRGVDAAAASVMEAVGFLSSLFGFFLVMGMYLSQRFGAIIVWPLVVVLFLASASASAYATFK